MQKEERRSTLTYYLAYPLLLIWNMSWKVVNEESKRVCALASLYSLLENVESDNDQALSILNRHMHLTQDLDVLRLPVIVRNFIWRNTSADEIRSLSSTEKKIAYLLNVIPSWLEYSTTTSMQHDLRRVLECCTKDSNYDHLITA